MSVAWKEVFTVSRDATLFPVGSSNDGIRGIGESGVRLFSARRLSLPSIRDSSAESERTLYWEHEKHAAIRQGDWKLVTLNGTDDRKWELYNLSDVRTETEDVATANPDRVASMKGTWKTWATQAIVLPWPKDQE